MPRQRSNRPPGLVHYDGETVPAHDGDELPVITPQQAGDIVDGRYRLLTELGRGGMGVVQLAEDTRLQRRVAIKFLRPQATDTDVARFRREAQLLASLSHPNVVKVFDLGEYDERPYFVMEFLDGRTLADHLHDAGGEGLPVDVALGFGRHLCEALDAVHRQGIIHRDIKPGNVIITGEMAAVLMDFGLARKDLTARERGTVSGTPQYLAPEDIRGAPLAGDDARRSDIYALGITLYELIAGRPPFADDNTAIVLHHQLHDPPPLLCDIRPDVPSAFERVIMRALEKDPYARQSSCSELVVELKLAREQVGQAQSPARVTRELGPAADVPIGDDRMLPHRGRQASPRPQPKGPRLAALVLNGGPMRDSLADGLRIALPNCEVAVLPSGSMSVLESLFSLRPACVVIDMDLLEESPFELCALLRSSAPTARVPIVAVGEQLSAEQEELLIRMGVHAVLPKPIDPSHLATQIAHAVSD